MTSQAVTLGIKPAVRIECRFWLGDDGWNGSSEYPAITVQAGTFEQAKIEIENALGKQIDLLLRASRSAGKMQVA